MDVWEAMKTHTDSRFVREVAQKLWGTKGLKQVNKNFLCEGYSFLITFPMY